MEGGSSNSVPQTRTTGQPTFGPGAGKTISIPPINQWTTNTTTPIGRPLDLNPIELPSAKSREGTELVLPINIAKWEDTIRTWECATITHLASLPFAENSDKALYFENLLGPMEKLTFPS